MATTWQFFRRRLYSGACLTMAVVCFAQLLGSARAWSIGLRTSSSSPPSPSPSPSPSVAVHNDDEASLQLRIRTTRAKDLSQVAKMLVSASSPGAAASGRRWMDHIFIKADIEALLQNRLEALNAGKAAVARLEALLLERNNNNNDDESGSVLLSQSDRLSFLWSTSDALRHRIAKASHDTGEDNIWRHHNLALPPSDTSWFNHLQMTAENALTGEVVGFCEVAMLSNPVLLVQDAEEEECYAPFSPAITNLATATKWRRRGIASRLLQSAQQYAQRHWGADSLGLYVEQSNAGALALYKSQGYQEMATCPGDDVRLGAMWYMSKELQAPPAIVAAAGAAEENYVLMAVER